MVLIINVGGILKVVALTAGYLLALAFAVLAPAVLRGL